MSQPFLEYLTVFRSRLGAVNIVLDLTGLSHLPEETLLRKARQVLEKRILLRLSDRENDLTFSYLKDKGLVPDKSKPKERELASDESSKGRYAGLELSKHGSDWSATRKRMGYRPAEALDALPVFQTDLWMADSRVRSTIGVPTPDNTREIMDLTYQLRLLSRGKATWTSAGYLIHSLRSYQRDKGCSADRENPFLFGIDAVALLRQVIECDGFLIRELLRALCVRKLQSGSDLVRRDDIAADFANIVRNAVDASRGHFSTATVYKVTQFRKLIDKTAKKRSGQSRGPGVLEHRVSPRLEWLVDFGYLSKEGLSRNGFTYRMEPAANSLLDDLDRFVRQPHWAENVAVSQWVSNPIWADLRLKAKVEGRVSVFSTAYQLLQRPIGPAPLNDVAFLSAVLSASARDYSEVKSEIISFAQKTAGVTLSGGRTHRGPQNIYISEKVLRNAGNDC
jgi:hypothetical protein